MTSVVDRIVVCIYILYIIDSFLHSSPITLIYYIRSETLFEPNVSGSSSAEEFRLASIFSSQMVLQREPHSPSVWGFGPPGSTVSLTLTAPSPSTPPAHYEGLVGGEGVWSVSIGSWPAGESVRQLAMKNVESCS